MLEAFVRLNQFFAGNEVALIALSVWSLVWKGLALWRAGRKNQKGWFIALLIVNTAGILEMVYLFVVSKIQSKRQGPTDANQPSASVRV